MAKSETILGRRANRRAFDQRVAHNLKLTRNRWGFTVSAFTTRHGKLFYTDALSPAAEAWPYNRKGSVVYRIRIYPKAYMHGLARQSR